MRHKTNHLRRLKYSISAAKIDLFGDMDIFDFGNIVMACTAVSTLASLALYLFCFYCI